MAEGTALDELAVHHGVALEYCDIRGKRHRATPESLAAILGGMGVRTDGGPAAEAALAADEAARCPPSDRRPLTTPRPTSRSCRRARRLRAF